MHLAEQERDFGEEAFRRHIEELDVSRQDASSYGGVDTQVNRTVKRLRLDAVCLQCLHLVLHETDEWRDDDACPRHDDGRNLVAQALAASCRHQNEGVVFPNGRSDDVFLVVPERIVPEIRF